MNNIINRVWNRGTMVNIEDLRGSLYQNEQLGHTFVISGVDGDGNVVSLSGTVDGAFLRPDNTTVAISGSASGGKAYVTLPANCYDVPGKCGLTIYLTADSQKTALYAAVVTVTRTSSDTASPGTTASVVDLVNAINEAISQIPATDTALKAAMAPTYSNTGLYAVGSYAWYNGVLKRCIVPITTAESYTAAHWTDAALGNDLRDLKSAFNSDYVGKKISIIGDSFSAYNADGYKYPGYAMFYPRPSGNNDVKNVNQMWWKRIIDLCNGQFEVNASLASGRVTYDSNHSERPTFYDRVSLIGSPDVIFVELGHFDAAASVALGEYDFETAYTSLSDTEFRPAYIKGVKALQATYPNAKIVCLGMDIASAYWRSIRHIALTLGATFIDARPITNLSACPSVYGMIQISDHILHPTDMGLSQWKMPADGSAVGLKFEETDGNIELLRNNMSDEFNSLKDENGELTGFNPQVYQKLDVSSYPVLNLSVYSKIIQINANARSFFVVLDPNMKRFVITKTKGNYFRAAFISKSWVKDTQPLTKRVAKDGAGNKIIVIDRNSAEDTHLIVQYYDSTTDTDTPQDILDTVSLYVGNEEALTKEASDLFESVDKNNLLDSRQMTTDDKLFSAINGTKFRKELNTVLTTLKKDNEKLLHVPTFEIIDNTVYACYLYSDVATQEYANLCSNRLVIFPLSNGYSPKTYVDIVKVTNAQYGLEGDTFDGSTFELVHDAIINQVDSNTLRINFWAKLASENFVSVFNRTYTISTGTLSAIERSKFRYYTTVDGQKNVDLDIVNLKMSFDECGIPYVNTVNSEEEPVLQQPVSYYSTGGTKYYFTGLGLHAVPLLVRTTDFKTWEYVTFVPFKYAGIEVATYYSGNNLYCCIRRDGNGRPLSILTKFNILTNAWGEQCMISDQGSRPFFFKTANDVLYLINNPKGRNRLAVTQINTSNLKLSTEVQEGIFTTQYMYPAVQVANNEFHCIYSENRANLNYCKFTIGSISRPTIYSKLEELFEIT